MASVHSLEDLKKIAKIMKEKNVNVSEAFIALDFSKNKAYNKSNDSYHKSKRTFEPAVKSL